MTIAGMHEPFPDPFAPTQVYLILAITVAGVSWLIKPEGDGLRSRRTVAATVLIACEVAHTALYGYVAGKWGVESNFWIHVVLVLVAFLFLLLLVVLPWLDDVTEPRKPGSVLGLS